MCEPDAVSNTQPAVRRTASGAIDTEFYARRARAERAEYLRALLGALARCALSPWRCLREKIRARARRRELDALSARELGDIGISRSDFDAIVDGTYFTDTSRDRRGRSTRR